ncbi:AP complex subunit sigma [Kluyveromyces marxianus]|uniref:AP complex subunit sigma n=2 Tax=Kluyveromyces marxianus TaxID=4911 RepID=W0TBD4_KLUMD|nr:AP-1 complex subunit sigma-1 [Kluyveromyces marxianus DMKU3-1042]KAG0669563.1 Sigma1B-adaptin [Kluyveromyces marxianus]KAG0678326.1 Sigma1B-adaptin [Kluyveromyces marxianus]QGN16046.1 AP-1 complex subunit sigma-1 [Kluyveromyces marxianus]BAO40313.1 AP-1 complex subunit sigma-1 [Kluyveromyces marxianus DMKU3-1042]BAP71804.1 AP-1 complex subunit sigma-1 [Kluyveromyces marxianus]
MSQIKYMLLASRQGKTRLIRWFQTLDPKQKTQILREVTTTVLSRKSKMCNILEYQDHKVVYKRYASLYFIAGIDSESDNELLTLEIIHRFVETMDKYFGNVCELDIIFNFSKAYSILDEMIMCDGSIIETSKEEVIHAVASMDAIESNDDLDRVLS